MAVNFSITVSGEEVLKRAFRNVEETVSDFTPEWKEVQAEFYEIEQDQFQSSGAKGASGKWAEVSEATEAFKIREFGTFALLAGTLIATGKLYESLTRSTADSVFESNPKDMAIGTSLPYAKFHQTGTRRMPARKPIDLSDAQKDKLARRIRKSLVSRVKKETGLEMTEDNFSDAF